MHTASSATLVDDACFVHKTCTDCLTNSSCFWCGGEFPGRSMVPSCATIGPGGGILGPQNQLTHLAGNLFLSEPDTCAAWYVGQCGLRGRALAFIILACAFTVVLVPCIIAFCFCCKCCCFKRRKTQASDDRVPLIDNAAAQEDVNDFFDDND